MCLNLKRFLLLVFIFSLFQGLAAAYNERPLLIGGPTDTQTPIFMELWNNAAFYDTNLEKKNFGSMLGRFEGKVGANVFSFPLQVYGVYYTALSQSPDYWDNYAYTGGGVRLMPWRDYKSDRWYTDWFSGVRFYAESLNSSYFKNAASAEGLAKTDSRYGMEIWHAWNRDNPNLAAPWGELWFKGEYRQTNFGWEKFEDYVVYCQPKFGWHLTEIIDPYIRADVTMSGKSGPSYSFLNIADYGAGIRFVPLRNIGRDNDLFHTFNMFIEVLGVSYLKDAPANPANRVSSDARFGVEVSYGR